MTKYVNTQPDNDIIPLEYHDIINYRQKKIWIKSDNYL